MLFTSKRQNCRHISKVPVALIVSSPRRNRYQDPSKTKIRAPVTKRFLSRRDSVMKPAQTSVRLKMNCDGRKPTFKVDEPSNNLPSTFVNTFVCQARHIACTPSKEDGWVSKMNTGPTDLLTPSEREKRPGQGQAPSFEQLGKDPCYLITWPNSQPCVPIPSRQLQQYAEPRSL